MGRYRDVGSLRHRAIGSSALALAIAYVALGSYHPRDNRHCWEPGPCYADRGDDGDCIEDGAVRDGPLSYR